MPGYRDTESTLPPIEELTGADRLTSAEIAADVLDQLGSDVPGPFGSPGYRTAYARHRIANYPDVAALADGLGLR